MGDPVLEVRPNPTPLEYAQKKRTLEMQELVEKQRGADLDRVKGLLDRGMASRADFDAAKEAPERAVLRRKMAEEELAILDRGKAVVAGRAVESIIVSPVARAARLADVAEEEARFGRKLALTVAHRTDRTPSISSLENVSTFVDQ